jgi:hypothetical protein
MNKPQDVPSPRGQPARRRLLLGAAALLPTVHTLASGGQTAMASNVRCWDRARHHGGGRDLGVSGGFDDDDTARFSMTNDEWLRKQVYTGMGGGHPAFCAMSNQAACIDPANPTKAAAGSVWIVNGERIVAGAGVSIDQVSAAPQAYGLVYVDQQGTMATLDPDRSNRLRPVREPCWNSIIGGRISPLG